jgi:hypothetical protein
MLNIKEAVDKTRPQLATVKEFMEQHNYFDPQQCNIYAGLKRSTQRELSETLHKCTLRDLLKGLNKKELNGIKEFLPTPGGLTTGSLGTAGAQYLVPTWISQKLYTASTQTDKVPLISADVFEPRGGKCTVPTQILDAIIAGEGEIPTDTFKADGATVTLEKIVRPLIATNEMLEDQEYGLIERAVNEAGRAIGRLAFDKALACLVDADSDSEGYGERATEAGAADETLPEDIFNVFDAVSRGDGQVNPIANTMIVTPEAWSHSIAVDGTAAYFPTGIQPRPIAGGFDIMFHNFDTIFSGSTELGTGGAGAVMTKCVTLVFDRKQAMVTARKNWLRVENYANPVMDLAGAVISGRQDSVTVVDCAIGVVTEA